MTRNGDLSPSWRFWDPVGDKILAWRLTIFWRFLNIFVAIFGDFDILKKNVKILLHKLNINTFGNIFCLRFFISLFLLFLLFCLFLFSVKLVLAKESKYLLKNFFTFFKKNKEILVEILRTRKKFGN